MGKDNEHTIVGVRGLLEIGSIGQKLNGKT